MSELLLCPKCRGWRQVVDDMLPMATGTNWVPCPLCDGRGYLVSPLPPYRP